jgi:hypothetical protein
LLFDEFRHTGAVEVVQLEQLFAAQLGMPDWAHQLRQLAIWPFGALHTTRSKSDGELMSTTGGPADATFP